MPHERAPIDWKSFNTLELVWPEWLVEGLIPQESTVCLYGQRGTGKTFLALDFALCIASGRPWKNLPVKQGKVAYLLAERTDGLKRRMLGWAQHQGLRSDEVAAALGEGSSRFQVASETPHLDRADDLEHLLRSLDKLENLALVILDPLPSFNSGSENDARDMQRLMDGVRRVAARCRCSVLLVHHTGKGDEAFDKGARGSSALEAAMDTVLALRGSGGHIQLSVTKQREHEELDPITLESVEVTDDQNRPLGKYHKLVGTVATKTAGSRATRRTKIEEILLKTVAEVSAKTGQPASVSEVITAASNELDIGTSQIRERLKKLTKDGRLQATRDKGKLFYSLNGGDNTIRENTDHKPETELE